MKRLLVLCMLLVTGEIIGAKGRDANFNITAQYDYKTKITEFRTPFVFGVAFRRRRDEHGVFTNFICLQFPDPHADAEKNGIYPFVVLNNGDKISFVVLPQIGYITPGVLGYSISDDIYHVEQFVVSDIKEIFCNGVMRELSDYEAHCVKIEFLKIICINY